MDSSTKDSNGRSNEPANKSASLELKYSFSGAVLSENFQSNLTPSGEILNMPGLFLAVARKWNVKEWTSSFCHWLKWLSGDSVSPCLSASDGFSGKKKQCNNLVQIFSDTGLERQKPKLTTRKNEMEEGWNCRKCEREKVVHVLFRVDFIFCVAKEEQADKVI